jgi:hypothetical protein
MNSDDPTLWPIGTLVRVVKLSACNDPLSPSSSWEDWKIGELNDGSLPVDYELQGSLIEPMEAGKSILVLRTHRNGVRADGLFQSTPVREFKNGAAITLNSIYLISREASLPST